MIPYYPLGVYKDATVGEEEWLMKK
jgi:hypothetical protein